MNEDIAAGRDGSHNARLLTEAQESLAKEEANVVRISGELNHYRAMQRRDQEDSERIAAASGSESTNQPTNPTTEPTPTPSDSGPIMADEADERMMANAQSTWIPDASSPTGYVNQFTGEPGSPTPEGEATELEGITVEGTRSELMVAPTDHRVRIKPLNPEQFYGVRGEEESQGEHLLSIIRETNGVIFPYTPNITYGHNVNYNTSAITHANQDYFFYDNTSAVQFQISAKFTAQNEREAKYFLAAKHFFQVASKMRFGDEDEDRGLPPPMLVFSGYGDLMFNNLPIIMNSFNVDLTDDVDYTQVEMLGTENWVPASALFQFTFTVQQTPLKQRTFNFDRFASGDLLKERGWI